MVILLAVALFAGTGIDAAADAAKAAFKDCIKGATIETFDAVSTTCQRKYRDSIPANSSAADEPTDPIAKEVADNEADNYALLLTAERYDPSALCAQAGLTARAYLDAKMMGQYDRWKSNERRLCAEATKAVRVSK